MKIVVAPLAAEDLQDAYSYIAEDSEKAAERLLARMAEAWFVSPCTSVVEPGR